MAFSAMTDYGLVAWIDLATAYGGSGLLQTSEICKRHRIPERSEQISVADIEACLEGDGRHERKGTVRIPNVWHSALWINALTRPGLQS